MKPEVDTPSKSAAARRLARELVLQGLYQKQLSGNDTESIRRQLLESEAYPDADQYYFHDLWDGTLRDRESLAAALTPLLDRAASALSPIERSIMTIAAWELGHRFDIPYRVVINEAVDIARMYGGTDGYKYVNAILDKLAAQLRADEIRALRAEQGDGSPG
jgi:N utilization substance protein B